MKAAIGVIVGLMIGAASAILYQQSLPPEKGSPEADLEVAQRMLQGAEIRIAELEARLGPNKSGTVLRDLGNEAKSIADDIQAGRTVNVDDIYGAMKPALRNIAPILDRVRAQAEKAHFESLAGEITRKYKLSKSQEASLLKWFENKAEANAKAYTSLLTSEETRLKDLEEATEIGQMDRGLDQFMERILSGTAREEYRAERMGERAELVQQEADGMMHRLDRIVDLDERQKDSVFILMATSSPHFDRGMQLDGVDSASVAASPQRDREQAISQILRDDQRRMLDAHREEARARAAEELSELGLSLPNDWDIFYDTR